MGRPRPAVGGSHSHSLDSVPSPGLGQRKYLCVGVPKGAYSVGLLGAKTEIPARQVLTRVRTTNQEATMKRQFTIGTVVFGILVSAVIALHANETRVDAAAVTQDKAQASPTKEERQHSRQAGPLLITVTQARHDAWKRMETDSIPGISVSGWGVTVTVKNTTDTAATVTIDPTALRIEDAEGKVCGEHPADAKVIA